MFSSVTEHTRIVRLNLPALVGAGKVTAEEASRLAALATTGDWRRLFANLFLIFGALLTVAGILALAPSTHIGLALAAFALIGGSALHLHRSEHWWLLGRAAILMGILGLSGWIGIVLSDMPKPWPVATWPLITGVLTIGAIAYRDAFLAALAPVALGYALGGGTGYWFASYALFVEEPVVTTLVFSGLTMATNFMRWKSQGTMSTIALVAGRVSFIIMNFGLWVGSLWGDRPGSAWWDHAQPWEDLRAQMNSTLFIPAEPFALVWCGISLVTIYLGTRLGHRFIANASLVFLAINLYTQFHEVLVASPWGLVAGGLMLIALAIAIIRFQRPSGIPA